MLTITEFSAPGRAQGAVVDALTKPVASKTYTPAAASADAGPLNSATSLVLISSTVDARVAFDEAATADSLPLFAGTSRMFAVPASTVISYKTL